MQFQGMWEQTYPSINSCSAFYTIFHSQWKTG